MQLMTCCQCGNPIEHGNLCATFDKGHYNEHEPEDVDEPEGFVSDERFPCPEYGSDLLCIRCLSDITKKGLDFTYVEDVVCKHCNEMTVPKYVRADSHSTYGYCSSCGFDQSVIL